MVTADSTASASRIVGVASFRRPTAVDTSSADQQLLVIEGVHCHIPYIVKVS